MNTEITVSNTLDARGLNCPLPILRTRKAISAMGAGEVLEITSSDPGSLRDIPSFCEQTGHELLGSREAGGEYVFQIRKSSH